MAADLDLFEFEMGLAGGHDLPALRAAIATIEDENTRAEIGARLDRALAHYRAGRFGDAADLVGVAAREVQVVLRLLPAVREARESKRLRATAAKRVAQANTMYPEALKERWRTLAASAEFSGLNKSEKARRIMRLEQLPREAFESIRTALKAKPDR